MDRKKKSRIIIIAISAFVVVCFFIFINFLNIIKAANPEAYLKLAVLNTAKNIYSSLEQNYSLNERTFSMKINGVDGNVSPQIKEALTGAELNMTTQTDMFSQKMDAKLDITLGSLQFKENELYISPDIIAAKAPAFYRGHEYVTVDPNTFAYELWEITNKVASNAVFANNGKAETTINKKTAILDKMSYTVPRETVNEAYSDLISLIKKRTGGELSFFEKVDFTDDLTVSFYIDKKHRVVKLEIDEFQINGYSKKYEQEATASFGFYIDLFGNKNLSDGVSFAVTAKSGDDDYTVAFISESGPSDGAFGESSEISIKSIDVIVAKLAYDTDWKPEDEGYRDFNMKITANVGFNQVIADVSGSLTDAAIKSVEAPDLSDSKRY